MIFVLLIILLLSMICGGALLYAYSKSVKSKSRQQGETSANDLIAGRNKKKWKHKLNIYYQKSYIYAVQFPLIQGYVAKVRKRISSIHSYDELTMRKETMRITFFTLGITGLGMLIMTVLTRDMTTFFFIILGAVVINGMLIDTFVNKVEDRLLIQMTDMLADVRHQYHEHGMVDEAIYEAGEVSKYEMSLHAKTIYDVLTSNNPEEKLEAYYEVAPNRFLKAFAGLSFLVKEYGDKTLQQGSMYLHSLNRLKQELYFEIIRTRS